MTSFVCAHPFPVIPDGPVGESFFSGMLMPIRAISLFLFSYDIFPFLGAFIPAAMLTRQLLRQAGVLAEKSWGCLKAFPYEAEAPIRLFSV